MNMESKTTLSQLLNNITAIDSTFERPIQGIKTDSRTVTPGDLFIACVGQQYDGRKYIAEAIQKGATAVIYEHDGNRAELAKNYPNIPLIAIANLQQQVGKIAARFYGDPSVDLTVIGFTGTNGKTSCSQFTARALEMAKKPCGVMGTLGIGFPGQLHPINLTTPDAITLQAELANFKKQHAVAVAMEVSSHSLAQYRVDGIHFNTAVFTNLTRDHLDYHGNMLNYAKAKQRLFLQPGLQHAVLNLDDEYGKQFLAALPKTVQGYGYSIHKISANIPMTTAQNIRLSSQGFVADIDSPWGKGTLQSALLGRFNVSNLLAVLTTLCLLEIPFADALKYLSDLTTVPGRLQMLGGQNYPTIVVDYAHTPDALEKVLKALREHCSGKLWCVFGCGGERDRGKRPIMAEVAEKFSDEIIVTDDNPRREYSQKIIEDIMAGFLYPHRVNVIADRSQAISKVLASGKAGDVILIAGKGHEPYQIIGTEKLPFSDVEEVQKWMIHHAA